MSLTLLFLQIIVILAVARGCGLILRAFGQPMVIGEMAAGFVLGPVIFGTLFPQWHGALFPPASLPALSSLATLGVVLFMFVVGAEVRAPRGLKSQVTAAALVAGISMVLPLGLGIAIAPWLHPTLAPPGVGFWPFALFVGVALSITAFPVLARILKDRGLTRSRIGQLSLSAAGMLDAAAWILLALVMALASAGGGLPAFVRISLGLAALAALVLFGVRPLLARLLARHAPDGRLTQMMLAALLLGTFGFAMLTEWLHLHAVFGAFLFGLCLPRDDRLLKSLEDRIEPLAIVLLMPIFFALAGLGTTATAFGNAGLGAMALILVVATVGKIVGAAAGARLGGYDWRESLSTGALMNSRGLMELIVIKIGLDAGLIGAEMFTILLVMALVTTAATGPLLSLLDWQKQAKAAANAKANATADTKADADAALIR